MTPNAQFPDFANMYAPAWMGYTPILANLRDMEYDLDLPPVTVPPGQFVKGNQLPVDSDSDFLVREVQFVVSFVEGLVPVAPSDIRVRLRDGDGRLLTAEYVPVFDLNGPFAVPWPLRRGAVLIIDYQNVGPSAASVWMVLKGWKRLTCDDPAELRAPYTPMYQRYQQPNSGNDLEDFEYPFSFTSAGVGDLLKQPLQTDNDADFLWRGITGAWNTNNQAVAAVSGVGLTFYDQEGVPLSQSGLVSPWGSPICGEFRELVLASGGARPSPHFPEILIPRGGVVLVDISFGAVETVAFSLRGMKVYGHCA
jgi:hypothetical protein